MTDKLPPNLLALFAPRPALRYLPPSDVAPESRKTAEISGVADFLKELQEYKQEPFESEDTWFERRERRKAERRELRKKMTEDDFDDFKPSEDPQIRGDPYRTLFIARLSYDTKESDLEKEFGRYGPIERIRIVTDVTAKQENGTTKKKQKPHRGYAFIVYEREKDMKAAYKETDGIRIRDRKVVVDVERGRTVKGWRPLRFGGGLGGRGYTKTAAAKPMGFSAGPGGPGGPGAPGGFRGSFRGGFSGDRGGFGGDRGGFRGGRGGFGGGRGGIGYGGRGGYGGGFQGGAPAGAPAGPGGRGGFQGGFGGANGSNGSGPDANGYGDRRNGYEDRGSHRSGGGSGGRFADRDGRGGGSGRYNDYDRPREDRDRGYRGRDDDQGRKRPHDDSGYDDPRKRRY